MSGRVGEWASGRVGEWASGQVRTSECKRGSSGELRVSGELARQSRERLRRTPIIKASNAQREPTDNAR